MRSLVVAAACMAAAASLAHAADFADELGMNTGPIPASQQANDKTVFTGDAAPEGFDDDLLAPFRTMSQSEFERHAVQSYSQAIAIVNQPTEEDEEPVRVTAVRPQDLELFWEYVFNPTGMLVDEEERAFLSERLQAFISREGLHAPELALPRGYLTRGNALHFMYTTNKEFYALKDRIQARKDAEELRNEL